MPYVFLILVCLKICKPTLISAVAYSAISDFKRGAYDLSFCIYYVTTYTELLTFLITPTVFKSCIKFGMFNWERGLCRTCGKVHYFNIWRLDRQV